MTTSINPEHLPVPQCVACGLDRKGYTAKRCKHCELTRLAEIREEAEYEMFLTGTFPEGKVPWYYQDMY